MEQDEFDKELDELEVRLERLRSLYEQYFLGIERIEPSVARKDVDRRFWRIRKVRVRNTAKRFKLQTLIQRYNTLQQHWGKVCRQIENGTYIRQLARARRRMGDVAEEPVLMRRKRPKKDSDADLSQSVRPQAPPTEGNAMRDGSDRQQAASFDRKIEQLHQQLSDTQAKLSPGSRTVSRKALAESLRMTEAKLRHKHRGKQIDFRVVVKDGRAAIKPVVRKGDESSG